MTASSSKSGNSRAASAPRRATRFGHVVGDAYEEPVLLIKLAWGGKSLAKDFRPPSSGGEVGPYYKEIIKRTKDVLGNLKKEFPELGDRKYELAGFGWHQG